MLHDLWVNIKTEQKQGKRRTGDFNVYPLMEAAVNMFLCAAASGFGHKRT